MIEFEKRAMVKTLMGLWRYSVESLFLQGKSV